MYQRVEEYDFVQAFKDCNRTDHFTRDGLNVLFEHLVSLEEDTGEEIELDVVALCCEYYEYSLKEYNNERSQQWETIEELAEHLADYTTVAGTTGRDTVIFQAY